MSNVYKRFRGETDIQFIMTALDLQTEITKYVTREKVVPKKWRLIVALPLVNKIDEMVDNITFANSIYPRTQEELANRRAYQQKAIANCYQVQNLIVKLEKCINTVTITGLETIIDLLCKELQLLKAWKKNDKMKV
jgi:hypothetical protein